jgi:PHD/YefM family antitoxin component YafN of YafNO toxin-antitoxin module
MSSVTISEKEKTGLLANLLMMVSKEPVMLREQGEDVAVMLSPEQFEVFANIRRKQIEDFLAARNDLAAEAQRNGLTEDKLAGLLDD